MLAITALEWMAGEDDLLMVFLGATGADIADVRAGATDPAFLGGVLDFLLQSDQHIEGFCSANNYPTDAPYAARQALPGGEQMNWT